MPGIKKNNFAQYVAGVLNAHFAMLGISMRQFAEKYKGVNYPTLRRVLNGDCNTNISVLAHYCDLLGLEIIIRPKQAKSKDNENKD